MAKNILLILATAVLIFCVYGMIVQFGSFTIRNGQNQDDTNMIRLQGYLAAPYPPDTVLVGSSLTFRIPPEGLEASMANLGLAGDGAITGLEIVSESNARPKLVLVEINRLAVAPNRDRVKSLFRFPERFLRKYFRVFRAGYDPVNLIHRAVSVLMHKADFEPSLPPEVTRSLIVSQRSALAQPPDVAGLRANLRMLAILIQKLRARGAIVGFFEMPIEPGLEELPGPAGVRAEVAKAFPAQAFCWIALPAGAPTVDGIHLNPEGASGIGRRIAIESKSCEKFR